MDKKREAYHQKVAEKLIEQLEQGTAPWQKPWQDTPLLPYNAATGKPYRGVNILQLMSEGREDARWMTYRQAQDIGAQVKKGEKGTVIQYAKYEDERIKRDENGKPLKDKDGKSIKETVKVAYPKIFQATVFNAEQIENLPPPPPKPEFRWNPLERAEQILSASGAEIKHVPGNRAFYRPSNDSITLPEKSQFPNPEDYYATALHELEHWSGHESRLARDLKHPFGSEGYAKEELRAEIASMMLGQELGIGHDPSGHASYVASWIKVLKNDPQEIYRAASDAQKIQDYVLALEQKQTLTQGQAQEQEQPQSESVQASAEGIEPAATESQSQDPAIRKAAATLKTLIEQHGWNPHPMDGRLLAVSREFEVGAKDGLHQVLAGWQHDRETLREFHLVQNLRGIAEVNIAEWDSQGLEAHELAERVNARAAQYADAKRIENGLEPRYQKLLAGQFAPIKASLEPVALEIQSTEQVKQDNTSKMAQLLAAHPEPTAARLREVAYRLQKDGLDSQPVFGQTLPHDWTGDVQIVPSVRDIESGQIIPAEQAGRPPEGYGLYVRKGETQQGEPAWQAITASKSLGEAQNRAEQLYLLDALLTDNPYEQAVQLAFIEREQVARNPEATDDERVQAKEALKTAQTLADSAERQQQAAAQPEPSPDMAPPQTTPPPPEQPTQHQQTAPVAEKTQASAKAAAPAADSLSEGDIKAAKALWDSLYSGRFGGRMALSRGSGLHRKAPSTKDWRELSPAAQAGLARHYKEQFTPAGQLWDKLNLGQRRNLTREMDISFPYHLRESSWKDLLADTSPGVRGAMGEIAERLQEAKITEGIDAKDGLNVQQRETLAKRYSPPDSEYLSQKPDSAAISGWLPSQDAGFFTNKHIADWGGSPPHLDNWQSQQGNTQVTQEGAEKFLNTRLQLDQSKDSVPVQILAEERKANRVALELPGRAEVVEVNTDYLRYFLSKYPGCELKADSKAADKGINVKHEGQVVGAIMALNNPEAYRCEQIRSAMSMNSAVQAQAPEPVQASQPTPATEAKKQWHEMTLAEFAAQVRVDECHSAARKWEVIEQASGDRLSFADAPSQEEAIREVHQGKVNNALHFFSPEGKRFREEHEADLRFPPAEVLAEYPSLLWKFPEAAPPAEQESPEFVRQREQIKQSAAIPPGERLYLAVPTAKKEEARAAGARWDAEEQLWYASAGANMKTLAPYLPQNIRIQQELPIRPQEEFSAALRSAGLVVDGEHPIMDGKSHRIAAEGGKKGSKDGFYVGHLDGIPAGFIANNKTGTQIRWKSNATVLTPLQTAKLKAEAAQNRTKQAAEKDALQQQTAARVSKQLQALQPPERPTAYQAAKGIRPQIGALTDSAGKTTFVPAFDAGGKHWTTQYIQEDGSKRFAKDGRKAGCFHPVGGMEALKSAPVLVIAEGYATAASVSEALGHATVAAFDSGNLKAVALALHEKFPNKPIVIAGDDDKQQETQNGRNPGREKAIEAAKAADGSAVFPIFAPGEQQGNPKGFSDFNDLDKKSVLGRDGLERQIKSAVLQEQRHHQQRREQQQKLTAKQEEGMKI